MAGPMLGMNPEEVTALATQMDTAAGEIETTMNAITSKLSSTTWVGADRDKFESDWSTSATAQLRQVKDLLSTASAAARRNASEQTTASGA